MNGVIHKWFPKVVYTNDCVLMGNLLAYENTIRSIISSNGAVRNSMLAVDSTHKTNDQLHLMSEFETLVHQILLNSTVFLIELGYVGALENLKISNMWANISHEHDFIFPHVHSNSLLSGAFYVKKYPDSKISFFNDIASIMPDPQVRNELNYAYCEYDCNPGRLLLWKSDFLHGTKKQHTGEKIVISFNITN